MEEETLGADLDRHLLNHQSHMGHNCFGGMLCMYIHTYGILDRTK